MRKAVTVTTILLLAAAAQAQTPVKYELKQKYTPGDYVMTMTSDMDQTTQMEAGMSMAQKIQMVMVSQMSIGKPGPEGQKVEVAYKRIKQSVTGGPMSLEFDSAGPADEQNPMLAPMYNALLDTTISFTVGPDGEISNVSGMDKMWEKMAGAAPGGAAAAMMGSMKEQFGDKMLEQIAGPAKMFLPDKAVAKGESWTVEQDLPLPMIGQAKMQQECRLADVTETAKGKMAIIKFSGKMKSDEPAAPTTMGAVQMKFNSMDIQQSGTMKMDLKLGMVTDSDMDQTADMAMEMTPPEGQGMPMKMSISQKGKMKMEFRPGKYKPPTTKPTTRAATKPAKPAKDTDF